MMQTPNPRPTRRAIMGAGFAVIAAHHAEGQVVAPAGAAPVDAANIPPRAFIDGVGGPGWVSLGEKDFVNVNCAADTWTWNESGVHCTGKPTGVIRTIKTYTNFEMTCQWRHLEAGGNSGIFVWTVETSLEQLKGPGLPRGIEVQVLDLGYTEKYAREHKKPTDWFTCHGDVFSVGNEVKFTPFPPVAPQGKRSFPTKNLSRGINEWNHYYIRAINGEVRLWVNGEEVSGGTNIEPRTGSMCLESEGAPIDFKDLRLRELP